MLEIFSVFGSILLKDNGTKEKLQEIDSSASKLGGTFDSAFSKIASTALKVGGIIGAGLGFKAMFSAAEASQQKLAQMDSVLKSTGDASGMTKAQLLDLADAQGKVTDFSKGTNIATENLLLTFTNIGSKVFPDALKSVNDMSQALGQDTSSSAIQLGKALNDPIKGVTALQKVGVTFTAGQKEQIKAMVESGNVAGAQSIILKELQKEFGGSAEAAGKTFGGQLTILKNQIAGVGGSIASTLMPSLTSFMEKVNDNMPKIQSVVTGAINTAKPYIADIVKDVGQIASNLLPNLGTSTSSVGNIVKGVVAGGFTAFKDVLDWIAQHGTVVDAALVGMTTAIIGYKTATAASNVVQEVQSLLFATQAIKCGFAKDALAAMKVSTDSNTAAQWLLNTALDANPIDLVITGIAALVAAGVLLYKNWDTVAKFADTLWTSIKTAFNGIKTSIESALNSAKTTALNVLNSAKGVITELNITLQQHQTAIKTTATILGIVFGPALIKSGTQAIISGTQIAASFIANVTKAGVQAAISGVKITASFVASMITTGAQAVANGAKVAASFIASMITAGAQAVISGAQIVGSFVASLITTAAQAIATGAAITGSLIVAIVSYAAEGWKTVASITAQTAAWLAQKVQVIASTTALVASKVATVASTTATSALTAAQWLLNAAMSANPIGLVITVLAGLAAALITAYNKSSTFRNGVNSAFESVNDTVGSVVNWVKTKIHELADLPDEALKWGKDMIDSFVDGIKSGFDAVGDAVGWVADKISALLHHSTPDEGPLKNDNEWMPDFMQSMADGITNNSSLVTDALEKLTQKMKAKAQVKAPTVNTTPVDNSKQNLDASLNSGLSSSNQAVNSTNTIATKISGVMTTLASKFTQNGQDLDTNLGKAVSDNQDKVLKPTNDLVATITDKTTDLVQSFITYGQNTDTNLGNGITANASATTTPLATLITTLTTAILAFIQNCIQYGQNIDTNLGNGITNSSTLAITAIGNILTTLTNNIQTFILSCIQYGESISTNLATGITNTVQKVTDAATQITDKIGKILGTFADSCTSIGKSIGESIGDGIRSSEDNVVSIAHELTQKIINAFTGPDGFDIHSPSRKLFQIGSYVIQGFVNGLSSLDVVKFFQNKILSVLGAAGDVSKWLSIALMLTGTPMDWLPGLLKLTSYESGDPGTIGSGSATLVNGIAVGNEYATGLLQMLPSTFSENMLSGFGDIMNPIDNAISAIRYIKNRYGSVYNTPLFTSGGVYNGYATGTDDATEGAHPVAENGFEIVLDKALRWFKGGETVLNHSDSLKFLDNIRNTIDTIRALKDMNFTSFLPNTESKTENTNANTKNVTINQYNTVNSPQALKPSEIARANKKFLKEIAFQYK